MNKDEGAPVDRFARALGIAGFVVSGCSLAISAWSAWTSYKNRADAAEQITISFAAVRGEPVTDVNIPIVGGSVIFTNAEVTVPGRRKTWNIVVSNVSLSSNVTLTGLWTAQRYTPVEPVYDELQRIRFQTTGTATLPVTLEPSKTMIFKLVTDTPRESDHVPVVQVATSRGGRFLGTPPP